MNHEIKRHFKADLGTKFRLFVGYTPSRAKITRIAKVSDYRLVLDKDGEVVEKRYVAWHALPGNKRAYHEVHELDVLNNLVKD